MDLFASMRTVFLEIASFLGLESIFGPQYAEKAPAS
jgi:hypothetical protein